MPKVKTKKGAQKRFLKTKTGKVKGKKANLRHILTAKSPKQKRQAREGLYLTKADAHRIKTIMPY